jgi:hypothetical protein
MRTAVCYYSRHHGNTLKVLEAMAQEGEVTLIDVTTRQAVQLENMTALALLRVSTSVDSTTAFWLSQDNIYLRENRCFLSIPTAEPKAPVQRPSWRWPGKKNVRCWGNLAAKAMTPLALLSWWAVSRRATRMRETWRKPVSFIVRFKNGIPRNEQKV